MSRLRCKQYIYLVWMDQIKFGITDCLACRMTNYLSATALSRTSTPFHPVTRIWGSRHPDAYNIEQMLKYSFPKTELPNGNKRRPHSELVSVEYGSLIIKLITHYSDFVVSPITTSQEMPHDPECPRRANKVPYMSHETKPCDLPLYDPNASKAWPFRSIGGAI